MPETWTIQQFKDHLKKGGKAEPHQPTKKKGNGDKAKAEMEMVLKLLGVAYVTEHQFADDRKYRFDFAIPSLKIGIEYEGINSAKSRHTSITGYSKDTEKYNLAARLGWIVQRYTALTYTNLTNDLKELLK